jgi:hypothetical protein
MNTKTLKVDGQTFRVGRNVKVNNVRRNDKEIVWRMHRTLENTVELRVPLKGTVVVEYDILEPVPVAAYYPFIVTKKNRKPSNAKSNPQRRTRSDTT